MDIKLADVEYDDGFGGQTVAKDLLVVGDGWWLERNEYDGSEWWEFRRPPQKPDKVRDVVTLMGKYWATLKEQNSPQIQRYQTEVISIQQRR